jgi:acyl carrier protein
VGAVIDPSQPVTRAQVVSLIQENLAEILEISAADIVEDAPFSDLGADSLALIELVEALEESLATYAPGFHIDDEDLEGLTSVGLSADYVTSKLQSR